MGGSGGGGEWLEPLQYVHLPGVDCINPRTCLLEVGANSRLGAYSNKCGKLDGSPTIVLV